MTAAELIAQAAKRLSDAGVPEPELDAKILFLEAFHMDQVHFLMNRMRPLTEEQRAQQETYEVMIDRQECPCAAAADSGQPGIYGADLPRDTGCADSETGYGDLGGTGTAGAERPGYPSAGSVYRIRLYCHQPWQSWAVTGM